MTKVCSVAELITAWGGNEAFGRFMYPKTSQPAARACTIKARGFVPPEHYYRLLRAAARKKIEITIGELDRWRKRATRRNKASEAKKHETDEGAHASAS